MGTCDTGLILYNSFWTLSLILYFAFEFLKGQQPEIFQLRFFHGFNSPFFWFRIRKVIWILSLTSRCMQQGVSHPPGPQLEKLVPYVLSHVYCGKRPSRHPMLRWNQTQILYCSKMFIDLLFRYVLFTWNKVEILGMHFQYRNNKQWLKWVNNNWNSTQAVIKQ
jgi:hypothetical protein